MNRVFAKNTDTVRNDDGGLFAVVVDRNEQRISRQVKVVKVQLASGDARDANHVLVRYKDTLNLVMEIPKDLLFARRSSAVNMATGLLEQNKQNLLAELQASRKRTVPWCNGSTPSFGVGSHGSNPCGTAIHNNSQQ